MRKWFKPATYYKILFKLLTKLPKKNVIVFDSFDGRAFSDNPKALYEYAKQKYSDYQLIWHVRKNDVHKFREAKVPYYTSPSWQELWLQTRAKLWIVNARTTKWKQPGTGTTLLQTWHGTPLKKLGLDIKHVTMPNVSTEEYHRHFLEDVAKWDYLLAANEYSAQIFSTAFAFDKDRILLTGYPRNDKLVNATVADIEKIKQTLNLSLYKKIILYAPTWRDDQNLGQGKYYLDLPFDFERFSQQFPDCVLLVRAHYLISENLNITQYENVVDVSSYGDISDLYLISDMLITDYSSVFFDYAILNRPMIFYAYDYAKYQNEIRGFYFDYQKVPGPIVENNDALFTQIEYYLNNPHVDLTKFQQQYCQLEDGHASARVFAELTKRGDING